MTKKDNDHARSARDRIRELNDRFRQHGDGNGSILLTIGVQALGDAAIRAVVAAVQDYDRFTTQNDPHGEHDFGSFIMDGNTIFWKLDYYSRSLNAHSPDPADGSVTHRVLTIMLASEY